jgi:hypothetical protein
MKISSSHKGFKSWTLGEKQLFISIVTLAIIAAIVITITFVVILKDNTDVIPTTTTNVSTSTTADKYTDINLEALVNDENVCLGFDTINFTLTFGNCENVPNNGQWEYNETNQSLVNFLPFSDRFLCLHTPISNANSTIIGTPLGNENINCNNVQIDTTTGFITHNGGNECIVYEHDNFIWGSCTNAFAFIF